MLRCLHCSEHDLQLLDRCLHYSEHDLELLDRCLHCSEHDLELLDRCLCCSEHDLELLDRCLCCSEHDLELLELWQWTGLKWSDVCCRLLTALDCAIADCYLATEAGELDREKSPGVRVSHFFTLQAATSGLLPPLPHLCYSRFCLH